MMEMTNDIPEERSMESCVHRRTSSYYQACLRLRGMIDREGVLCGVVF